MQILHVAEATLSSLRARRTVKTVVKCKFYTSPSNLLVTSCSSDVQKCGETHFFPVDRQLATLSSCWSHVQNCGRTMIFVCRELPRTSLTCLIHFCARGCNDTYISKFLNARRCSETQILILLDEPSRRIRWVHRTKL